MVMRGSRNLARLPRAVSMIPRMRRSRSEIALIAPRLAGRNPRFACLTPSHALPLTGEPAEVVVRRASPLRRDHAGADRPLGRARGAEYLELPRLDDAPEDLHALARPSHGDAGAAD